MAIATQEQTVLDKVEKHLYIGGEWIDATEERTLPVEDPATGEALCEVADATPEDAKRALDAAVDMQAEWAAVPPIERGEILRRAFEKLVERADELALLMTLEMGKPIAESKAEIAYAAEFFRWFAGEATRIHGQFNMSGNGVGRVLPEQASEQSLKVSTELGGNAPFLIFEDADLDAAVEGALLAKMRNIGEACTSANRFHVAEPVAEEFAKRLAEKMGNLKIGRGTEDDVKVGPLIDEAQQK